MKFSSRSSTSCEWREKNKCYTNKQTSDTIYIGSFLAVACCGPCMTGTKRKNRVMNSHPVEDDVFFDK